MVNGRILSNTKVALEYEDDQGAYTHNNAIDENAVHELETAQTYSTAITLCMPLKEW
jgi:hypothetical protein